MEKKEKKRILKMAQQLIYMCSERTPSSVKQSILNTKIALAAQSVNEVAKELGKP
jgi:hypothetical protein